MAPILLHFLHLGSVGFVHPPETSQNVPRPKRNPLLVFPRPKKDGGVLLVVLLAGTQGGAGEEAGEAACLAAAGVRARATAGL